MFKEKPEYAETFLNGIKNGNIKLTDYPNITEAIDSAENAINELNSGKLENKTFVEKINGTITKLDDSIKPVSGLFKTLGTIATGVVACTGLLKLKNDLKKDEISAAKTTAKINLLHAKIIDECKKDHMDENTTVLSAMMRCHNRIMQEQGKRTQFYYNFVDGFASLIDKYAPLKKDSFQNQLNKTPYAKFKLNSAKEKNIFMNDMDADKSEKSSKKPKQ